MLNCCFSFLHKFHHQPGSAQEIPPKRHISRSLQPAIAGKAKIVTIDRHVTHDQPFSFFASQQTCFRFKRFGGFRFPMTTAPASNRSFARSPEKMSPVIITDVTVGNNPAPFVKPFQFEIAYECLEALKGDLEWKLIYVGSAKDETCDQLLNTALVGPMNVGKYQFVFKADPPDRSKIPEKDIVGVTVLLLSCSYLGQMFFQAGYYVNNEYDNEQLKDEPPQKVLIDSVQRCILADKPRVRKFQINFHPENTDNDDQSPEAVEIKPPVEQPEVDYLFEGIGINPTAPSDVNVTVDLSDGAVV